MPRKVASLLAVPIRCQSVCVLEGTRVFSRCQHRQCVSQLFSSQGEDDEIAVRGGERWKFQRTPSVDAEGLGQINMKCSTKRKQLSRCYGRVGDDCKVEWGLA